MTDPAATQLEVLACMTGQSLCTVSATPLTTVGNLKVMIELATQIPARAQKLLAGDSPLSRNGDILGPGLLAGATGPLRLLRLSAKTAVEEEDRQLALEHAQGGGSLRELHQRHRSDREIVLVAVERNVAQLQHVGEDILSDEDIMIEAIRRNTLATCYASAELWSSRRFAIAVVQIDGMLLERARPFQDDADVCMAAVQQTGYALKHASSFMRDRREVVLEAVRQRGTALCYASEALKCDRELVLEAVRNERMAAVHARGGLRDDPEVQQLVGAATQ